MRNFINDHILKYFGLTCWQLLSRENDRWYFENYVFQRIRDASNYERQRWDYVEVWIDSMMSPPYLLMLIGVGTGTCSVLDPAARYKVIKSFNSYAEARLWLLEDEYEILESRSIPAVDLGARPTVSIDIPERVIEKIKGIVAEVLSEEFTTGRL
jgi:hypothetical protein